CSSDLAIVAFSAYLMFGGWKLLGRKDQVTLAPDGEVSSLNPHQRLTLAIIGLLIVGVVFVGVDIGMAAFSAAVLLTLFRAADEQAAINAMPWSTSLLVCGVTVLIVLLEPTGGTDHFSRLLSSAATRVPIVAFVADLIGSVSAYSSTSAVALPAFLPTVPGLVENLVGSDPLALASTMNVAGHLVDVSPLSTIGALCVASV